MNLQGHAKEVRDEDRTISYVDASEPPLDRKGKVHLIVLFLSACSEHESPAPC